MTEILNITLIGDIMSAMGKTLVSNITIITLYSI